VNTHRLLATLWTLFLIRGVFYASVLPLWEGFDEWAHYSVVQNLAIGGPALFSRDDSVSHEVQAALELAPWQPGAPDAGAKHAVYWRLPEQERSDRERKLRSIPVEWAREPAIGGPSAYEGQQTPLYYWLCAPLYKLTAGLSLLTRVWILRFFGLLMASAVIPVGFLSARFVFQDDLRALGVAALIAAMPELMMLVSQIGNHSLAVMMGSLVLFALFRWKQEPRSLARTVTLGAVLGVALLTKAYFLALIPPVFVFGAIWAYKKSVYRQALFVITYAAVISGWWYVRNWTLTHSLTGEQVGVAANKAGLSLLDAALGMNWLRATDFAFLSHLWLGGWSFLVVRSWMYHFFAVFAGLAGAGLLVRLLSRRKEKPSSLDLALLLGIYLTFLAALGYQALLAFETMGVSGTLGYYLYAIVVAEAILVSAGLEAIFPAALLPGVIPAAVFCFAALEFFGMHFYAIAYYTGFTARLADGRLPALHISQLSNGGLIAMLNRLAMNKPEFLNARVIAVLWVLFLASTLALIGVAAFLGGRTRAGGIGHVRRVQQKRR
jgi:hypothetical protein